MPLWLVPGWVEAFDDTAVGSAPAILCGIRTFVRENIPGHYEEPGPRSVDRPRCRIEAASAGGYGISREVIGLWNILHRQVSLRLSGATPEASLRCRDHRSVALLSIPTIPGSIARGSYRTISATVESVVPCVSACVSFPCSLSNRYKSIACRERVSTQILLSR